MGGGRTCKMIRAGVAALLGCAATACGGVDRVGQESPGDSGAAKDATAERWVDAAIAADAVEDRSAGDATSGLDANTGADAPSLLGAGGDTSEVGAGGQGASCERESDCAPGYDCGYPVYGGCSALGTCVPTPHGPFSGALTSACGCDGVNLLLGGNFYYGYAPTPIAYADYCAPDASPPDEAGICSEPGGACMTSSDCCPGLSCIDNVPTELFGYCAH
jgi:hypothetical protein